MIVRSFDDWRAAVRQHMAATGQIPNAVALRMQADDIAAAHNVRCLLSDSPGIRRKGCTLASAIAVAEAVGLELHLSYKNET